MAMKDLDDHPQMLPVKKAIVALSRSHPAWAHMLTSVRMKPFDDPSQPTALTDGRVIYLNLPLLGVRSHNDIQFIVAHECWHVVMDHPGRGKRAGMNNHELANIAADMVTNGALKECTDLTPPDDAVLDKHGDYQGLSYEGVYWRMLKEQQEKEQQQQQGGLGVGDGDQQQQQAPDWGAMDPNAAAKAGDDEDNDQPDRMQALAKAKDQAGKLKGKQSAALERILGRELRRPVDLLSLIRDWIGSTLDCPPDWSRPKKKYMPAGLYMPRTRKPQVNDFVVAIDSSSSVIGKDWALPAMIGIAQYVSKNHPQVGMTVLACDSRIVAEQRVEPGDPVFPHGVPMGYSTSFDPVFEWVRDNAPDCSGLIYMTDMEAASLPAELNNPTYPVLWLDVEDLSARPNLRQNEYRSGRPGRIVNVHDLSDITRFVEGV